MGWLQWLRGAAPAQCPVCLTPMERFKGVRLWWCKACSHMYDTTWQEVKSR